MIDYCVLGSGVSGSSISNLLSNNHKVIVIDKARGVGGRSSNKKYKNVSFDHGLQYFSPKTKGFKNFINSMTRKGVLKKWDGNHLDFTFKNKNTNEKIIGKHGNNDLCKHLLRNIEKRNNIEISLINYKKKFWILKSKNKFIVSKNIIITFPFFQSKLLAKNYLKNNFLQMNVKMEPNITLLISINNNKIIPVSSIKIRDSIISWAANENSKSRFKAKKNYWTIQASYSFSKKIINKYKKKRLYYSNLILKNFLKISGFNMKQIKTLKIHGWKYSYNRKKTKLKSYWDSKIGLGMCADWFIGPNAECAWLSSKDLYNKIKKNPPKKY